MSDKTDPAIESLVHAIHTSPTAAAIVATGAGVRALAWLMEVAGASRTVLDAQVPYSSPALGEYVGRKARQHVSAAEAAAMAEEACWRGLKLDALARPGEIGARPVVGLACTATIATDRVKRGDHRAHIAVRNAEMVETTSIVLEKGARDRDGEEEIVSRLILNALARACGLGGELPVELTDADRLEKASSAVGDLIAAVARGDADIAFLDPAGGQHAGAPGGRAVLSGSFNPLHEGHEQLAAAAMRICGKPVVLELSVTNVEKPPLPAGVLHARLAQMRGVWPVAVTRAPTFVEKSRLMPDSTFVIGYDTAVRLFDDRFYPPCDPAADSHGAGSAWAAALAELLRNGCDFLVAGRLQNGQFKGLQDISVPDEYSTMLREIPEGEFRMDVSSTEIRSGQ